MKEVNFKLLLNFAAALFMLQNVSGMDASSSDSDDEISAAAAVTNDFDLQAAIQNNDVNAIRLELQARRAYLKSIRSHLTAFLSVVQGPAEAFEKEMVRLEKVTDKKSVQNLSNNKHDFDEVFDNAAYMQFDGAIGGAFSTLKTSLQPYLANGVLLPFAQQILVPLQLIAYARIPCMGCADSVYHLVLLIDQALGMLIDNPFIPLPASVTAVFDQIADSADLTSLLRRGRTYLPHTINIADALANLSTTINTILGEKGAMRVTPKDASQIESILKGLLGEQETGVNNTLMFSALGVLHAHGGKTLNELVASLTPVLAADPITQSIFLLVIQHVLYQAQGPARRFNASRLAAFQQKAETPSTPLAREMPRSASTVAEDDITFTPDQLAMEVSDRFDKFVESIRKIQSGAKIVKRSYYNILISNLDSLRPTKSAKIIVKNIISTIDGTSGIDKGAVKQALLDLL